MVSKLILHYYLMYCILNEFFFVSVSAGISPLDSFSLNILHDNLGQLPDYFIVPEYAVYSA
jgi:hypothetical protein